MRDADLVRDQALDVGALPRELGQEGLERARRELAPAYQRLGVGLHPQPRAIGRSVAWQSW